MIQEIVINLMEAYGKRRDDGDKFLIDCCKQHISSNYGVKSKEMKNFKIAIKGK